MNNNPGKKGRKKIEPIDFFRHPISFDDPNADSIWELKEKVNEIIEQFHTAKGGKGAKNAR